MIDMGKVHGKRLWYTGRRSMADLIRDGEIIVVPDGYWIAFKRAAACTEVERRAALTFDEINAFYAKHGGSIGTP